MPGGTYVSEIALFVTFKEMSRSGRVQSLAKISIYLRIRLRQNGGSESTGDEFRSRGVWDERLFAHFYDRSQHLGSFRL